MPRIVSIWLEHWPITRLRRAARGSRDDLEDGAPVVVAAAGPGGLRLTAVDALAASLDLWPGGPLARARARIGPRIVVHPSDPEADAAALARLCLWAKRYTPTVSPFRASEGGDGLFLDIAGASHLMGGETRLMADLARRLAANALPARLALADTPGAAFALARHGGGFSPCIVTPGVTQAAIGHLPVRALRVDPAMAESLHRLGLRRIGQLMEAPRAPLAKRFGKTLLMRLDQALGLRPEPLIALGDVSAFSASRGFLDPIGRQSDIVVTASRLIEDLAPRLAAADLGARALRLILTRVDGLDRSLDLALSEPTRCPAAVARLLDLRLDRLGAGLDAGFGFETVRLEVTETGTMRPVQVALRDADRAAVPRVGGHLADALHQRLGRRPLRLEPRRSHIPERAQRTVPWQAEKAVLTWADEAKALDETIAMRPRRPLVLLRRSEPVQDVLASERDGAPCRFHWRARLHVVTHAEGPERIAAEWWSEAAVARDYYLVEDEAGRRLWLYREGAHEPPAPARWFVHGLFA
ncbi:DNA polymerase Y family protein [Methylobacterium sp. Leaf108]|uniref:Y-family DNA polymerase n=1 Tax=Methylobacterium sp. Leaf108 TaxID=1736256 RepID=UPI0006FB5DA7|nr:DNA polymerase Y family protein [Methylobacterium sp. Leaf108]KQP51664.1 nucleotidyltransferase [Methylobacterium sp. Leaf108]